MRDTCTYLGAVNEMKYLIIGLSSLQAEAQDGDGIVSMETSPTDSNSAEIEGGVIPQADSGIYSSVGSTSYHDLDFQHTHPLQAQDPPPLLSLPIAPLMPLCDHPLRSTPAPQPSSILAPNASYNPIADLPTHLRDSLTTPPPGSDCFVPRLAEFWLTPSHEMLEKQVGAHRMLSQSRLNQNYTMIEYYRNISILPSFIHMCVLHVLV